MLRQVLLCALCVAWSTTSAAGDVDTGTGMDEQARILFFEGLALLDKKDHIGALNRFQAAYALSPNPKILVNLGTVLMRLGRDAEAADAYQRYLRTAQPPPELRAEVEESLRQMFARLGRLRIDANENGARVYVDGMSVGTSPVLDAIALSPGRHRIEGAKPGFRSDVVTIDSLFAGEERSVRLILAPQTAAAPAVVATSQNVATREPQRARSWGLAGLAFLDAEPIQQGVGGRLGAALTLFEHYSAHTYALLANDDYGFGAQVAATPWPRLAVAPFVSVGVDAYFVERAIVGVRGGAGAWVPVVSWLDFVGEIAAEHFPSVPSSVESQTYVLLGAGARVKILQ